jgi:hypothetical protein
MKHLALVLLVACSSSKPAEPSPAAAPPRAIDAAAPREIDAAAPRAIDARTSVKCLPVVAKECGCVYTCGRGESTDGTHWRVTHDFWKDTTLDAVVEPWCVDGKCTDAFAAVIVCSGICAPKPADPNCHC